MLDLRCCAGFSLVVACGGSFLFWGRLLIAVASLVAEHSSRVPELQMLQPPLDCCGSKTTDTLNQREGPMAKCTHRPNATQVSTIACRT